MQGEARAESRDGNRAIRQSGNLGILVAGLPGCLIAVLEGEESCPRWSIVVRCATRKAERREVPIVTGIGIAREWTTLLLSPWDLAIGCAEPNAEGE